MSKLLVELIPTTCHFSNVRTTLKPSEWDTVRKISYELAGNKCEICGSNGLLQGAKHRVECHEIWDYDMTTKTQKLTGLISLCPNCHKCKHIGRALIMGIGDLCKKHLAKVNKWTKAQVESHLLWAFALNKERSKHKWKLDISILKLPPYNLDINPPDKRIFEVKKYKKKKAKKKVMVNKRPKKNP